MHILWYTEVWFFFFVLKNILLKFNTYTEKCTYTMCHSFMNFHKLNTSYYQHHIKKRNITSTWAAALNNPFQSSPFIDSLLLDSVPWLYILLSLYSLNCRGEWKCELEGKWFTNTGCSTALSPLEKPLYCVKGCIPLRSQGSPCWWSVVKPPIPSGFLRTEIAADLAWTCAQTYRSVPKSPFC